MNEIYQKFTCSEVKTIYLNQTWRADNHGLAHDWCGGGSLPQQRPQECDALQGFAKSHLVRHDAPVAVFDLPTRHARVHERHSLQHERNRQRINRLQAKQSELSDKEF